MGDKDLDQAQEQAAKATGENPGVAMTITEPVVESAIAYKLMDQEDEKSIINAIQGITPELADRFVYQIVDKQTGEIQLTSLTWSGIKELVRYQNNNGVAKIRISPDVMPKPELDAEGNWMAMAYAEDLLTGAGSWGIGIQPTKIFFRNGGSKADPFAAVKAVTKAQRNALRPLIPEAFIAEMMATYLQEGKVQTVEADMTDVEVVEQTQVKRTMPSTPAEMMAFMKDAIEQEKQKGNKPGVMKLMDGVMKSDKFTPDQRKELIDLCTTTIKDMNNGQAPTNNQPTEAVS